MRYFQLPENFLRRFSLFNFFILVIFIFALIHPIPTVIASPFDNLSESPNIEMHLVLNGNRAFTNNSVSGDLVIQNLGTSDINLVEIKSNNLLNGSTNTNNLIVAGSSYILHLEFTNLNQNMHVIALIISYTLSGDQLVRREVVDTPIEVLNWPGFNFDPFWPLLMGSALTLLTAFTLNRIQIFSEKTRNQRYAIVKLKNFCICVDKYANDYIHFPIEYWKRVIFEGSNLTDIDEYQKKKNTTQNITTDTLELLLKTEKFNELVLSTNKDSPEARRFIIPFLEGTDQLRQKLDSLR